MESLKNEYPEFILNNLKIMKVFNVLFFIWLTVTVSGEQQGPSQTYISAF